MEEEDEPEFWRQLPPTHSHAFISTIWKSMKIFFKGQVELRKKVDEQISRLDRIDEGLRRLWSADPSTSVGLSRRRG